MDKPPLTERNDSDEALAAFTDRLLASPPDSPIQPTSSDPELARLEATLLRLRAAYGAPSQPPSEAAQRIHKNLAQEWPHTLQAQNHSPEPHPGWLSRLQDFFGWGTTQRRQHTLTLAFGVIAVLTLILTLWLSPADDPNLATMTSRIPGLLLFAFLILVAVIAFFWDRFH